MFLSVKLFIKRLAWCDMKEEIRGYTVFLTNEDSFFFFFSFYAEALAARFSSVKVKV